MSSVRRSMPRVPAFDFSLFVGAFALQGIGESSGRVGEMLAEKLPVWIESARGLKDSAVEAASNPFVVAAIVLLIAALVAVVLLAPAAFYHARTALRSEPSDLVVGDRREQFVDNLVSMPVLLRWADRCAHVQCLGPTGIGKTFLLLPWIVQDLLAGRSVAIVQIHGDLADKAVEYADALGATAHVCDFSDEASLKLNLLAGESTEDVAERAASAVRGVVSTHMHYESVAEDITRSFVTLARSYARHMSRSESDADVELWRMLMHDRRFLEEVLDVTHVENDKGRRTGEVRINAPWLDYFVATWFEQQFLVWSEKLLSENLAGVRMFLNRIMAKQAARCRMCPEDADPVLDLFGELQRTARRPSADTKETDGDPTLGKLIVVKIPEAAVGPEPAPAIAYWALKTVQDATITRQEGDEPLCVVLDELPTLVGKGHRAETQAFTNWMANVRKLNVAVTVAYQGYSLLPDVMEGGLDTNGRSVVVLGGLAEPDIRKIQRALGEEQDVEDERRTRGAFGTEMVTSLGRRRQEKPSKTFDEIKYMRRGEGLWLGTRYGADQKPLKIRARQPKPAEAYRKDATAPRRRRKPGK